jgi:hypothetical protein
MYDYLCSFFVLASLCLSVIVAAMAAMDRPSLQATALDFKGFRAPRRRMHVRNLPCPELPAFARSTTNQKPINQNGAKHWLGLSGFLLHIWYRSNPIYCLLDDRLYMPQNSAS